MQTMLRLRSPPSRVVSTVTGVHPHKHVKMLYSYPCLGTGTTMPKRSLSTKMLDGQHIAISGGAGAIALPTIRSFLSHGAKVSICDKVPFSTASDIFLEESISKSNVETDLDLDLDLNLHLDMDLSSNPNLLYNECDITCESDVRSFIENANRKFGPIQTACIHAGIVSVQPVLEESLQAFDDVLNVNIRGSFVMAQQTARHMMEHQNGNGSGRGNGHLLFTGSWVAENNWPGLVAYGASKAAVNSMMKSFALELAQFGIRANAICPGIVNTGMAKEYYQKNKAYHDRVDTSIPLQEMQPVASVTEMFVFLCSKSAAYMTGTVVTIDGGCHMVNKHTVQTYYEGLTEMKMKNEK